MLYFGGIDSPGGYKVYIYGYNKDFVCVGDMLFADNPDRKSL